jgi:hypothetical protein
VNALRAAVLALMPSTVTWYEGEVPSGSKFPRVAVSVNVPSVSDRSVTRTPQARRVRVSFVVGGLSDEAVHGISERVLTAFEGVRPVAAGWSTGPFELLGEPSVYTDRDVPDSSTGLFPRVCAFTLAAVVSRA